MTLFMVTTANKPSSSRAGRGLPLNFEAIAISNLQIEKLHQLGIEYDKVTGHRVDGIYNDDEDND